MSKAPIGFIYFGRLYHAESRTYEEVGLKLIPGYEVAEFELATKWFGGAQARPRIYILMLLDCEPSVVVTLGCSSKLV